MEIKFLTCMKCFMEDGKPSDTFYSLPLNDKLIFDLICEKGHETKVILQEQKFEILFEIGAHALREGYTDAAVTRFAVALERFYEFYIKVILLKKGISKTEFFKMWEGMSNKSERQYGAFLLAYQLDRSNHRDKILPTLIEDKWISFRNKVTHKGYISSDKEARDYGRRVYNFIREFLKHINAYYSKELNQVVADYLMRATEESRNEKVQAVTHSIPILLNVANEEFSEFDQAIAALPRYSKYSIHK